jgi:hypothetical protein
VASDGKFGTAKTLVPQCLDMADVKTIQQFFRKTWHYMDAYWYTDTPWAPYPSVDQSRLKVSNAYQSSYRKANDYPHTENPMTFCIYKLDDFSLSILLHQTLKTPGVLGLSCLLPSLPCLLCYILISDHL